MLLFVISLRSFAQRVVFTALISLRVHSSIYFYGQKHFALRVLFSRMTKTLRRTDKNETSQLIIFRRLIFAIASAPYRRRAWHSHAYACVVICYCLCTRDCALILFSTSSSSALLSLTRSSAGGASWLEFRSTVFGDRLLQLKLIINFASVLRTDWATEQDTSLLRDTASLFFLTNRCVNNCQ